ncbi:MAG TPA: response regulator [Gemmatimonadaceae bacterium]|jgi:Response regulators consisting of a CheY-like receiver domain and a winged-helix DNA-binding domain
MEAHVLLVEDSALVVDALRLLLEETGHRVSAAFTVRQAVDTARAERPDVILLDLTLGREDGLDVLSELARTDSLPPVAVAVTGHDTPEARERCLGAGCVEVLIKPISAMELPSRIRGWLASRGVGKDGASSDPAT